MFRGNFRGNGPSGNNFRARGNFPQRGSARGGPMDRSARGVRPPRGGRGSFRGNQPRGGGPSRGFGASRGFGPSRGGRGDHTRGFGPPRGGGRGFSRENSDPIGPMERRGGQRDGFGFGNRGGGHWNSNEPPLQPSQNKLMESGGMSFPPETSPMEFWGESEGGQSGMTPRFQSGGRGRGRGGGGRGGGGFFGSNNMNSPGSHEFGFDGGSPPMQPLQNFQNDNFYPEDGSRFSQRMDGPNFSRSMESDPHFNPPMDRFNFNLPMDSPNFKQSMDRSNFTPMGDSAMMRGPGFQMQSHYEDTEPPSQFGGFEDNILQIENDEPSQHIMEQQPRSRQSDRGPSNRRSPKRREPKRQKREKKQDRSPALPGEDEPEYDDTNVILDWYNSDLNLMISTTDFCSAKAISRMGFGYIWAGARATYGATNGLVSYEVRIDANCPSDHLEGEVTPNVLRCGWSTDDCSMQLGEEPFSFGYGGTAKISTNCQFKDYGIAFGVGDIIGCYLDMTTDEAIMRFTVNGVDQGIAFSVSKQDLGGRALFPHVLTKNQDFTVNFGQLPGPLHSVLPGYIPIGQFGPEDGLVRGSVAPASRGECQVYLMVGLPGAGKTTWAEKFKRDHPEKKFNILGTNTLIDRMKVQGLPRKRNYHGRWEVLIQKCTECFNEILKIAAKRRRNYILDQTNVFPTARMRKMEDFKDFQCKVVVVVPSDDEFQRRVAVREAKEGKEIPDSAVFNMKANFVLPDLEESYAQDVIYTELGPDDAAELVRKYNQEAFSKGVQMTMAVCNYIDRNRRRREEVGQQGVLGHHENDTSSRESRKRRSRGGSEDRQKRKAPAREDDQARRRNRSRSRSGERGGRRNNSRNENRRNKSRSRDRQRRQRTSSRDRSRRSRRPTRSRSRDRAKRQSPSRRSNTQESGGVISPWARNNNAAGANTGVGPMFASGFQPESSLQPNREMTNATGGAPMQGSNELFSRRNEPQPYQSHIQPPQAPPAFNVNYSNSVDNPPDVPLYSQLMPQGLPANVSNQSFSAFPPSQGGPLNGQQQTFGRNSYQASGQYDGDNLNIHGKNTPMLQGNEYGRDQFSQGSTTNSPYDRQASNFGQNEAFLNQMQNSQFSQFGGPRGRQNLSATPGQSQIINSPKGTLIMKDRVPETKRPQDFDLSRPPPSLCMPSTKQMQGSHPSFYNSPETAYQASLSQSSRNDQRDYSEKNQPMSWPPPREEMPPADPRASSSGASRSYLSAGDLNLVKRGGGPGGSRQADANPDGNDPSASSTSPDYKALLQYLKNYQKQMGTKK